MRFISQKLLETIKHCTWFSQFIWDINCNMTLWVLCTSTKETHPEGTGDQTGRYSADVQQNFSMLKSEERITGQTAHDRAPFCHLLH